MLYSLLKQRPKNQQKDPLPVAYVVVFYHGKQTPYPFSLNLTDCFNDPLKVMKNLLSNPINLIDVNQLPDNEIKRQQTLGIMTGALKYSRNRDISRYLQLLSQSLNSMDLSDDLELKFLRATLNYILGTGNSVNFKQFIQQGKQLPEPVRGELMTIAEQLEQLGVEKGLVKGKAEGKAEGKVEEREQIAINLLKEGAEAAFVTRITKLKLSEVFKLQARVSHR